MKAILFIVVLFFVTKSFAQNPDSASVDKSSSILNIDTANKKIIICIPSRKSFDNQPLLVVDRKVRDITYVKNLDPNNIASINVFKGDNAIKKYGKKAVNGVIVITTKKDIILQP